MRLLFFCLPLWLYVNIMHSTDWKYACHTNGGPMDSSLHCNSSSQQIVFFSNEAKQKRNLIIFDIDQTIMEAIPEFHNAVPLTFRNLAERCPFSQLYVKSLDLHLLLIVCNVGTHTSKYSVVFRKHFFDLLGYIRLDKGYSSDLALYTRGRPDYAQQIALGITECYKARYPKHNVSKSSVHIHSAYLQTTCHAQHHYHYSKWSSRV